MTNKALKDFYSVLNAVEEPEVLELMAAMLTFERDGLTAYTHIAFEKVVRADGLVAARAARNVLTSWQAARVQMLTAVQKRLVEIG